MTKKQHVNMPIVTSLLIFVIGALVMWKKIFPTLKATRHTRIRKMPRIKCNKPGCGKVWDDIASYRASSTCSLEDCRQKAMGKNPKPPALLQPPYKHHKDCLCRRCKDE